MNDIHYQVLSELYFVISYDELKSSLGMEDENLLIVLIQLYEKGWIRCYDGLDNELVGAEVDLEKSYHNYHYLASKEGLFAHNSL